MPHQLLRERERSTLSLATFRRSFGREGKAGHCLSAPLLGAQPAHSGLVGCADDRGAWAAATLQQQQQLQQLQQPASLGMQQLQQHSLQSGQAHGQAQGLHGGHPLLGRASDPAAAAAAAAAAGSSSIGSLPIGAQLPSPGNRPEHASQLPQQLVDLDALGEPPPLPGNLWKMFSCAGDTMYDT